jgi:hypothetical protein
MNARLLKAWAPWLPLALLCAGGCDREPAPTGGGSGISRGDPNATRLPAEARAAYHEAMEDRVSPEFGNLKKALADGNFEAISAGARQLIGTLDQLARKHAATCPVQFVSLHRQFHDQLSAVLETADGESDRGQLEQWLGRDGTAGPLEQTCNACHDKYRDD